MKSVFCFLVYVLLTGYCSFSQNVGIGTTNTGARLTVDSSIMLDQSNSNDGSLTKSALLFGSDKRVGIGRSAQPGSAARSGLGFYTGASNAARMLIDSTGRVGIGSNSPQQALHVNGSTYISGNLGLGTTSPSYSFTNTSGYNYMAYSLGIATAPGSAYLLDVAPYTSRFQGDVRINGTLNPTNSLAIGANATIAGSLTVNDGKGVAYNAASSANLKVYPFTTAVFVAVLGPHGSAETTIAFGGGFTTAPMVFVGNVYATGGTAGELNRVILVLSGCNNNSCNAKIINTDNVAVNYSIRWNCVAIGY